MSINVKALIEWAQSLPEDAEVEVTEDGLQQIGGEAFLEDLLSDEQIAKGKEISQKWYEDYVKQDSLNRRKHAGEKPPFKF